MDMPDLSAPPKAGPFTKLLLKIAGFDEDTLRRCPPHDWATARAIGQLMLCAWLYEAGLFSLISHRLFAAPGEIRPVLILGSIFLATTMLCVDSFTIMRAGWFRNGHHQLKQASVDITGGSLASVKAALFLAIRIALSIGLAQLTAIFAALLIFGSDINSRTQNSYVQANAHLLGPATALVDASIGRAARELEAQAERVASLAGQVTALRRNAIDPSASDPRIVQARDEVARLVGQKTKADEELRGAETFAANELGGIKGAAGNSGRAGEGPQYRAALERVNNTKARAQQAEKDLSAARTRLDAIQKEGLAGNDAARQRAQEQIPGFERRLADETARLEALKTELTRLRDSRENAIRKAIEAAPDHVALEQGFLAQVSALQRIASENRTIAGVILLIDVIAWAFEMAAVLAKVTSSVRTNYAAILAKESYVRDVAVAHEMMAELDAMEARMRKGPEIPAPEKPQDEKPVDGTAAADPFANPNGPQPQKRPRGRPRKPRPDITGPNGQGPLGPLEPPPAPA